MKFAFDIRRKPEINVKEHIFGENHEADLQVLLNECKQILPKYDEKRIRKAYEMCYNAHLNKLRKSGEPFYTHPLEVARIVINEIPLDDISVQAALLHNVVDESQAYSINDIRHEFGPEVAQIVDGVSKIKYVESQHINSDAQAENYRRLLLALFKDVRIILVKLADRLHNMRTLEGLGSESQERASRETLEIYAPFANRFGLRNIKWELEDLAFKYLHKPEYTAIKEALRLTREEREDYIKRFIEPINEAINKDDLLKKLKIRFEVKGRPKHIYSIYHKTILRQKSIDELYDLFAVRVILDTDDKNICFYVYGIIAGLYPPVPETFKDYISSPKKNGYKSIHTALIGPDNKPVEVQIRTKMMHLVSEKGVAAHFKYKRGSVESQSILDDHHIQGWMDGVREIFENAGNEYTPELLDAVRRKLFQDEIYVFTPANEFKKLPKDATALDFAFEIHSKVGYHAIGAKINGRVVPLYHKLQSGDRVEILTSKNQKPAKEWQKWVTTSKASQILQKYFKDEIKKVELEGKDIWNKKIKEFGISLSEEEMDSMIKHLKYANNSEFYSALGEKNINLTKINNFLRNKIGDDSKNLNNIFTKSQENVLSKTKQFKKLNVSPEMFVTYGACCKPLPGDKIIAMELSKGEIAIHKLDCKTIEKIIKIHSEDLSSVDWSELPESYFFLEIRIIGEDREYMLQDITAAIIKSGHTNINSVNINAFETLFDGVITLKIGNNCDIQKLFDEISCVDGVKEVQRL